MKSTLIEEYWKHTALNLGQAVRDIRFIYYHPDADRIAKEGTPKHYGYSVVRRFMSFGNNIFYSIVPPHLHHTREELKRMNLATSRDWFLHGYAPWRFPDPVEQQSEPAHPLVR